tara:strand:+ start:39 stop:200 length:162 start_codon:yes stop_codon:yes gene_type:complete
MVTFENAGFLHNSLLTIVTHGSSSGGARRDTYLLYRESGYKIILSFGKILTER